MNKIARFSALAVVLAASVGTTAFAATTYTEKDRSESGVYKKGQYYGITAGPAYRLNDWASIYGVVGVGYGKFQDNSYPNKSDMSDYGFSYGAGLQFNPIENVALDFSYEQSRIRNVDVGTWIAGVGYRF
ncbi:MAG: outer membrane protein OmpX [Klebsiella michiganensis]|nr:outer membrane protein OmpX [Klebsiella michiganensis]